MKALVTGGAGFVGRHLVSRLLKDGWQVDAVDSFVPHTGFIKPGEEWLGINPLDFNNFRMMHADCRDFFRAGAEYYDAVFHLAAVVGGRLMIEGNPIAVADDLSIDAAFWQWATVSKPGRVVCFSSSAAYPIYLQTKDNHRALDETDISFDEKLGMPDMTYGWAKLTCEYLARLAHQKHGLNVVVYRPFSGYGEDQDLSYPFPSLCKKVLENRKAQSPVQVWGSGHQQRDFIHIDDCIEAVIKTMHSVNDGSAVNLSTGVPTGFSALVQQMAVICGYRADIKAETDKPEGVYARYGSVALQEKMGIKHRVSLQEGISRVLDHLSR